MNWPKVPFEGTMKVRHFFTLSALLGVSGAASVDCIWLMWITREHVLLHGHRRSIASAVTIFQDVKHFLSRTGKIILILKCYISFLFSLKLYLGSFSKFRDSEIMSLTQKLLSEIWQQHPHPLWDSEIMSLTQQLLFETWQQHPTPHLLGEGNLPFLRESLAESQTFHKIGAR